MGTAERRRSMPAFRRICPSRLSRRFLRRLWQRSFIARPPEGGARPKQPLMISIVAVAVALVIAIAIYDLMQHQHAILRTFPIIGHFRYWLEAVGPELRQYIVTDHNEECPFPGQRRRSGSAPRNNDNN